MPAKRFVEALELHSHVANIGDVRSLVIHPASTTHSQLTAEEQLATGVTPGLVRLAVGLENIDDILADLEQGFAPRSPSRVCRRLRCRCENIPAESKEVTIIEDPALPILTLPAQTEIAVVDIGPLRWSPAWCWSNTYYVLFAFDSVRIAPRACAPAAAPVVSVARSSTWRRQRQLSPTSMPRIRTTPVARRFRSDNRLWQIFRRTGGRFIPRRSATLDSASTDDKGSNGCISASVPPAPAVRSHSDDFSFTNDGPPIDMNSNPVGGIDWPNWTVWMRLLALFIVMVVSARCFRQSIAAGRAALLRRCSSGAIRCS